MARITRQGTKLSRLLSMLNRINGASSKEIMDELDICRSTVASFIHSLRERGHEIASINYGEPARYYLFSKLDEKPSASKQVLDVISTGDEWSIDEISDIIDKDRGVTSALLRYVSQKNNLELDRVKKGRVTYYRLNGNGDN